MIWRGWGGQVLLLVGIYRICSLKLRIPSQQINAGH